MTLGLNKFGSDRFEQKTDSNRFVEKPDYSQELVIFNCLAHAYRVLVCRVG